MFYTALGNTAYYTFVAVPAQLLLALFLAILLNQKMPLINVFRTAFYLPTVTPTVASIVLFHVSLQPRFWRLQPNRRLVWLRKNQMALTIRPGQSPR